MATAFSRTLRSLTADSSRPMWLSILALSLLLSIWVAWGLFACIAVYAVTQTARLEVDRAVHPVAAPVAGRVVATRLVVGQEVQAGEVLVELDADAQRLQGEEERARLAALTAQLQAYDEELRAEDAAWHAEQQAAQAARDEAQARQREAEVIARASYEEAEVVILLPAPEFADQLEVIRSRAEVHKRQAAVDTLHLAAKRLEEEQQVRERDRMVRRAQLRREVVRIEGERVTAAATLARLMYEAEKRRIRVPIAGRLGEMATLQIGAVVREGDVLGVVLPPGALRVRAAGHTILADLNLSIQAGSHVAIVGPSGAGKSSLVGLFLGWHRAASGQVYVDGTPLDGARLAQLRQETAWVDPTVPLWNRSLLENLHYGVHGDHTAPLAFVLEQAELRRVLEKLPDGLQTALGEGGGLVSGGEGQRVRLGRALLRPGVRLVILDEPFRGLDRTQRGELLRRARRLWQEATVLCITHDVGATQTFERVLVVEGGRLVEDDTPATLAAQACSRYRALLDAEVTVHAQLWSDRLWRRLRLEGGQVVDSQTPGAR